MKVKKNQYGVAVTFAPSRPLKKKQENEEERTFAAVLFRFNV